MTVQAINQNVFAPQNRPFNIDEGQSNGKSFFNAVFGDLTTDTRNKVQVAENEIAKVANGYGNITELSSTLVEAQTALHAMTAVADKMIKAYNQIMTMGM